MDEREEHPSAFRLEAWHAGEPDPATEAHVGECTPCAAYVESLEGAREAFALRPGADDFLKRVAGAAVEAPRRPERRWAVVGLLAAAALLIAVVGRSLLTGPAETAPPGERLKGGPILAAIILREGTQRRETGSVRVRAGDRVRLEVTVEQAGPLRVELQEADAAPRVFFDAPVAAGVTALPEALAVDARPTDATFRAGRPEVLATQGAPDVATLHLTSGP